MWLLSITKCIKTSCPNLHHSGSNLLITKGMALSHHVFIFCYPIYKNWFTIQQELFIVPFSADGPAYPSDAIRCDLLIGQVPTFSNFRDNFIQIRVLKRP